MTINYTVYVMTVQLAILFSFFVHTFLSCMLSRQPVFGSSILVC